jgi:tRNA pseudouridine55 synthase
MNAGRVRVPWHRVDGVLLLDKPPGLSSNAALQRAKRLYRAEKAGHTGTLDPLASGLLPICFGEATKFAHGLLDASKGYIATLRFGVATTTGDAEGEPVREAPVNFTREDLQRAISRFVGTVSQTPPRYAALKFEGRAYYRYARAGVDIPRAPRTVEIAAIEIVDFSAPTATLRVLCGKGTYIRVLAEDLAEAAGSCAHLAALRRTATGPFRIEGATGLDALETLDEAGRDARLLAVDAPLAGLPRLVLDSAGVRALFLGQRAGAPAGALGRYLGIDPDGRFLGTVDVDDEGVRAVRLVRAAPS